MQFGFTLPAMVDRPRSKAPRARAGGTSSPEGELGTSEERAEERLVQARAGGGDQTEEQHESEGSQDDSGGVQDDSGVSQDDSGVSQDDSGVQHEEHHGSERIGEPRYSAQTLKEMARAHFGCSPHIVAGALSRQPSREWTVAEARNAIEEFRVAEHGGEFA